MKRSPLLLCLIALPALAQVEVTYDARGRVATVDDVAFSYASDSDNFASRMWTPESEWISIKPVSKSLIICKNDPKVATKCSGGGFFIDSGPLAGAGFGFGVASYAGEVSYYSAGTIGFSTPGQASYGAINGGNGGQNPAYTNQAWYWSQVQARQTAICTQQGISYGAICGLVGATIHSTAGAACVIGVGIMTQNCMTPKTFPAITDGVTAKTFPAITDGVTTK